MAGGGGGAAGPSEASGSGGADEYICPITTIMTDPVGTVDGFTYERARPSRGGSTKDTRPRRQAGEQASSRIHARSVIRSFVERGCGCGVTATSYLWSHRRWRARWARWARRRGGAAEAARHHLEATSSLSCTAKTQELCGEMHAVM